MWSLPILSLGVKDAVQMSAAGDVRPINRTQAASLILGAPVVLCHLPSVLARLKLETAPHALDILELFAFARPARFCLPTVRGLAEALSLDIPHDRTADVQVLKTALQILLDDLAEEQLHMTRQRAGQLRGLAGAMAEAGWGWGPMVLDALGADRERARRDQSYKVWEHLPEWSEHAPEPAPGSIPVDPQEARTHLAHLLGPYAEQRPAQADYASAVTAAFQPRAVVDEPHLVLAEAGTGTGKTLGYVAPASLWARHNGAPVWISTFTRNLQRQLDSELDRLYPDPRDKARHVVIRKGRENYLCLLNYEERVNQARPADYPALGLMARWITATRDGDMVGGDYPAWLTDLGGWARTLGLADHRGECIFSACAHYRKCYIERAIRKARRAEIVIANHALVMIQSALGGLDDASQPTRFVFDEGHHVFDAADSAFSAHLTAQETAEVRRWLLGLENEPGKAGGRSRTKGLRRRVEDLFAPESNGGQALAQILSAAHCLAAPGWRDRIEADNPQGETERFLMMVRAQVLARSSHPHSPFDLEADCHPLGEGLGALALALDGQFARLAAPLKVLDKELDDLLDDEASQLDSGQRARIDGIRRSLERRVLLPVQGWRAMLGHVTEGVIDDRFIDWFGIDRSGGQDVDVGMHRHWVDPTVPFAKAVLIPAHGAVLTSATLRDGSGDVERDWQAAERRTGAAHVPRPAVRAAMPSPFDYAANTKVLVVTDVRKDDLAQVASAYRELFLAAGGGGLGLFTAISRLRAVHDKIAGALDQAGIPLLAQHVDRLDTTTLVDIFRAEENSCLLGTDAVRDGVDVPGRSLRLIVFDRVPWPRPDILHRTRRAQFGGKGYDDMIARLRLKQAFGRLIRRADDHGIFVLLDPLMPSRLNGAFPDGVAVERVGLSQAVEITSSFLKFKAG